MKDSDWEILYELYKNPNLTKVANLLFITQPTLTKRLQNMEDEFDITIVDRTPKGLTFTKEGEYLAKQAKVYLDFIEGTRKQIKEFKKEKVTSIRIGSSYTYSKYDLSDILVEYKVLHPEVRFNIVTDQSNMLFRQLVEGQIDAAFIRGNYEGKVNRCLIAENEAYLVSKEPLTLEDLPKMQQINYKTNDRTKELISTWWREVYKEDYPAGMEVGYIDFAWQLINKGLGYTLCFLPDHFKNENNLCLTPLSELAGEKVIRKTWFYYPKIKNLPDALETFIHYIEKEKQLRKR